MKRKPVFGIGAALIVLIIAFVFILNREKPAESIAESPAEPIEEFQPMRADAVPEEEEPVVEEVAEFEEEVDEPIHYTESGMDPEDQPREFYVQDFSPGNLPEGFEMHNVRLTDRGFELEPGSGKPGEPRVGMVESPAIPFDFESNAIAPAWIDELPEGTSALVEVSVSPDGENWGMWHAADVDHDSHGQIAEFYPDGSPNPNYGYTPGGNFIWGNMTWKYFRYNIALYSETDESPAISSMRAFYQDSTLGQGELAELNVPDEEGEE